MTSRTALSAVMVEILDYYDGPQLVALKSNRDFKMLAVAVRRKDMVHPFFTCELRDKIIDQYFAQKCDLRYAFEHATGASYYFFELPNKNSKSVQLTKADDGEKLDQAFWPATGYFASNHGNPFETETKPVTTTRTFRIDGKWEAPEFARFPGKMSEIYALFSSINRFDDSVGATERGFFSKEINDRYWEGGGSYGGFFDELEARNTLVTRSPLKVDAISYASPGTIVFRGNEAALSDVDNIIAIFEKRYELLREDYKFIYSILRKEGLLRARKSAGFSSRSLAASVRNRTFEFARSMALEKVDDIFDLCGQNVLVFAKVVLSIFRRAEAVYQFYAEGRVQSLD